MQRKTLMRTFTCQPIKVTTRSLLLPSIKATQESTKTLFCRMDLLQTYLDGSRAAAAIYNLERISLYQAIIFGTSSSSKRNNVCCKSLRAQRHTKIIECLNWRFFRLGNRFFILLLNYRKKKGCT